MYPNREINGCEMCSLLRSVIVSVGAQNMGREFDQPIGRTSGNAAKGSHHFLVGNITTNLGIASTFNPMQ